MFGFSYGEIFLIVGATAALIGPKDLPIIARTAGRLTGRAIGYVQVARGHLDTIMQQSQARQVHKELQDTRAQIDAIRYEMWSASRWNAGPMTRRVMDDNVAPPYASRSEVKPVMPISMSTSENSASEQVHGRIVQTPATSKVSESCDVHNQATIYARLAELSPTSALLTGGADVEQVVGRLGSLSVLLLSAESAGKLPNRPVDVKGSDIVLESILEAEVAHNAKTCLHSLENQIKSE